MPERDLRSGKLLCVRRARQPAPVPARVMPHDAMSLPSMQYGAMDQDATRKGPMMNKDATKHDAIKPTGRSLSSGG